MPYLIQYFVNGLGRDALACSDLMSYLLFTPKYTRALIDIGYNDADRRIDEIEDFIFPSLSECYPYEPAESCQIEIRVTPESISRPSA